jgi:hypothetical protein
VELFDNHIKIVLDKKSYSEEDIVEMQIILVNNGDSSKTYQGSGSGHRANVWIYDSEGVEVWNNVPEFQDMDFDKITVPGRSEFVLQTVFWSQVNHTGAKIIPGAYEIISMNDHTPAETGINVIIIT